MIFPVFRAEALFFSKNSKQKNITAKTNEIAVGSLLSRAEELGIVNGTCKEIIEDLSNKIIDLQGANSSVGTEIENLKAEIESIKEKNERFYGIFFCIGILLGVFFAGPAWQLLDVAARQINLWAEGVFGIEQLNRRVGSLENSQSFLESRMDGLSNLVNRLKNK